MAEGSGASLGGAVRPPEEDAAQLRDELQACRREASAAAAALTRALREARRANGGLSAKVAALELALFEERTRTAQLLARQRAECLADALAAARDVAAEVLNERPAAGWGAADRSVPEATFLPQMSTGFHSVRSYDALVRRRPREAADAPQPHPGPPPPPSSQAATLSEKIVRPATPGRPPRVFRPRRRSRRSGRRAWAWACCTGRSRCGRTLAMSWAATARRSRRRCSRLRTRMATCPQSRPQRRSPPPSPASTSPCVPAPPSRGGLRGRAGRCACLLAWGGDASPLDRRAAGLVGPRRVEARGPTGRRIRCRRDPAARRQSRSAPKPRWNASTLLPQVRR
ncbi:hypothetical protein M885DRAFT_624122 [Pelagophyceae sp. CCMP2097]|nr:hypothetical protein M885DRAFT_624122 [Pelagophyceae sp. CCMP2097]